MGLGFPVGIEPRPEDFSYFDDSLSSMFGNEIACRASSLEKRPTAAVWWGMFYLHHLKGDFTASPIPGPRHTWGPIDILSYSISYLDDSCVVLPGTISLSKRL